MQQSTGFRKGPFLFQYHVDQILARLPTLVVVPSMTDNQVYHTMGMDAVAEYLQETSKNDSGRDFEDTYVTALLEHFESPEVTYKTPVSTIMYFAGVNNALRIVVEYYNERET